MSDPKKYALRGVSASKSEVHKAIKGMDKGLYPMAFCKILPDIAGGEEEYANIMHADTAGTKTSLAYIYWKETGDISVWRGIAQDAIVMNIDDMACVGVTDNIMLSSTIGRNKNLIPGEVVAEIINATAEFVNMLRKHGVSVHLSGGETADVGDIVRTIDVGYTAFSRWPKSRLIVNHIQPGDVVIGLASYGQAIYEDTYNSGMGSNGLTSARHDVFDKTYFKKYPESFDPSSPEELMYSGSKKLTDPITINGKTMTLGELVLSPTRTYLPVLKGILDQHYHDIHGIIHNTGGGHGKVRKFVKNKHIVKDNLLEIPPLFRIIQKESGTSMTDMLKVFNMGTRLEIYTTEKVAGSIIDVCNHFGIKAQVIGHVLEAPETRITVRADGSDHEL